MPISNCTITSRSTYRKGETFRPISNLVRRLAVSFEGGLLALGGEDGNIEIRQRLSLGTWKFVHCHSAGAPISALIASTVEKRTFFVGTASGCLYKLRYVMGKILLLSFDTVEGYIHALALNANGQYLAIAYGQRVALVRHAFQSLDQLGTKINVALPQFDIPRTPYEASILRNIHFMDEESFLLTYFASSEMLAYRVAGDVIEPLWRLQPNANKPVGSSAISPSGSRLAVANLSNGVDIYLLPHQKHSHTVCYDVSSQRNGNPLVDVTFLDEDHVAIGHADGYVLILAVGLLEPVREIGFHLPEALPIQHMTSSYFRGGLELFIAVPHRSARDQGRTETLICMVNVMPPSGLPPASSVMSEVVMGSLVPTWILSSFLLFAAAAVLYSPRQDQVQDKVLQSSAPVVSSTVITRTVTGMPPTVTVISDAAVVRTVSTDVTTTVTLTPLPTPVMVTSVTTSYILSTVLSLTSASLRLPAETVTIFSTQVCDVCQEATTTVLQVPGIYSMAHEQLKMHGTVSGVMTVVGVENPEQIRQKRHSNGVLDYIT